LILGANHYGADPTSYIGTVVMDSRNAHPIMLVGLFTDAQAEVNGCPKSEEPSRGPTTSSTGSPPPRDWRSTSRHTNPESRCPNQNRVPDSIADLLAPAMTRMTQA
jgi:hypothetical protein